MSTICCPRFADLTWDPEHECTKFGCPFHSFVIPNLQTKMDQMLMEAVLYGTSTHRMSHSTSNLEEVPKMPKSLLTLVGMKFRKQGLKILALMEQNHPVLLVREPDNLYDKNAIAVYVPIGYIKKEEAAAWAQQLDTLNPVGTVAGRSVQNGTSNNIEIDA